MGGRTPRNWTLTAAVRLARDRTYSGMGRKPQGKVPMKRPSRIPVIAERGRADVDLGPAPIGVGSRCSRAVRRSSCTVCWIWEALPRGDLKSKIPSPRFAGEGDVLGLADVEALALRRGRAGRPAPTRRQAHLLALGVDDAPLDVVQRHGVGREEQGVVLPGPLGLARPNGPPWKTPRMPSMICRTHFLRMIGWLTTCGDELVAGVGVGRAVRAGDVVHRARGSCS